VEFLPDAPGPAEPGVDPLAPASGPRIVFRSAFWLDLQHFLRAEARRAARGEPGRLAEERLSGQERAAWHAALEAQADLAGRDLLQDAELVRIDAELADLEESARPPATLPPALRAALEAAAPVHRRYAWPERDRAARAWIRAVQPPVERVADVVLDGIAVSFQAPWPGRPLLVVVTPDVGPRSAYTTELAPAGFCGLARMAPTPPGGGAAAVECVFHEAAHVLDGVLVARVEQAALARGGGSPPGLCHALLFLTAGVWAERALGQAGPYRSDLERLHGPWVPALARHWEPYLAGREEAGSLAEALDALLAQGPDEAP